MSHFLLTPDHLWEEAAYARKRAEIRTVMAGYRKQRRIFLGPHVVLCFENVWTLWYQIQEMLAVEKGGKSQIQDELEAYNPLIPQPFQWVATMMIEVPDPVQRAQILTCYTHIDETFQVVMKEKHSVLAQPIDAEGRTRDDGKTSSVHFLRFDLRSAFSDQEPELEGDIIIRTEHPEYHHEVFLTTDQKTILFHDLNLGYTVPCPFDPLFVLTSTTR